MYLDQQLTQETYELLLKAALEDKEPVAVYELGMVWAILGSDAHDEERVREGMELLLRAVELGCGQAASYIGTIYQEGKFGYPKDFVRAVAYYKQGAEMGDPLGMSNYGIALQRGEGGVERDDEEAFRWIKKAADADETFGVAQYNVALACHAGRGVKVDRETAKIYFQRAAKCGIEMARVWLASLDYQ